MKLWKDRMQHFSLIAFSMLEPAAVVASNAPTDFSSLRDHLDRI